jgi:hypothetical protein
VDPLEWTLRREIQQFRGRELRPARTRRAAPGALHQRAEPGNGGWHEVPVLPAVADRMLRRILAATVLLSTVGYGIYGARYCFRAPTGAAGWQCRGPAG